MAICAKRDQVIAAVVAEGFPPNGEYFLATRMLVAIRIVRLRPSSTGRGTIFALYSPKKVSATLGVSYAARRKVAKRWVECWQLFVP
jgi:hypothetical protein